MDETGKKWFEIKGSDRDIVVSARIRLARNLKGIPFPGRLEESVAAKILGDAFKSLKNTASGSRFSVIDLTKAERAFALSLMERHLISPEMVEGKGVRGVIVSGDEGVSIMVNEEDHLRIQVIGVGLCLDKCLETADRIDDVLDSSLEYAFDEKLGYLTRCPTNLGTGLRASVMLHLPALCETGGVKGMFQSLSKLGFAVRGIYGEGTSARGSLFQVSNQLTLGFTERELIGRMNEVVERLINEERETRRKLIEKNELKVSDGISRALGTLKFARALSSDEAISLLSQMRLGVSEGIVTGMSCEEIDEIFTSVQPGSMAQMKTGLERADRHKVRADILRGKFSPAEIKD